MKRYLILILIFLAIHSPVLGEDKRAELMRRAELNKQKPPATSIMVGANENVGSIAETGWPIIVAATAISDGETVALPSSLNVIMTDDRNQPITISFDSVTMPSGSEGQLFWIAPTQALSTGRYIVSVQPVTGFAVESGYLTIVEPNSERSGLLGILKVQQLLLLGKNDEALAESDHQIAADSQDPNFWIIKGDILLAKDLPDEASAAFEKALELEMAKGNEPLFIQKRLQVAFFRSLEKRGVIPSSDDKTP